MGDFLPDKQYMVILVSPLTICGGASRVLIALSVVSWSIGCITMIFSTDIYVAQRMTLVAPLIFHQEMYLLLNHMFCFTSKISLPGKSVFKFFFLFIWLCVVWKLKLKSIVHSVLSSFPFSSSPFYCSQSPPSSLLHHTGITPLFISKHPFLFFKRFSSLGHFGTSRHQEHWSW